MLSILELPPCGGQPRLAWCVTVCDHPNTGLVCRSCIASGELACEKKVAIAGWATSGTYEVACVCVCV